MINIKCTDGITSKMRVTDHNSGEELTVNSIVFTEIVPNAHVECYLKFVPAVLDIDAKPAVCLTTLKQLARQHGIQISPRADSDYRLLVKLLRILSADYSLPELSESPHGIEKRFSSVEWDRLSAAIAEATR